MRAIVLRAEKFHYDDALLLLGLLGFQLYSNCMILGGEREMADLSSLDRVEIEQWPVISEAANSNSVGDYSAKRKFFFFTFTFANSKDKVTVTFVGTLYSYVDIHVSASAHTDIHGE